MDLSNTDIHIDPQEVLAHLRGMGYLNITSDQLKSFIGDLKKLIKYDAKRCNCSIESLRLQATDLNDDDEPDDVLACYTPASNYSGNASMNVEGGHHSLASSHCEGVYQNTQAGHQSKTSMGHTSGSGNVPACRRTLTERGCNSGSNNVQAGNHSLLLENCINKLADLHVDSHSLGPDGGSKESVMVHASNISPGSNDCIAEFVEMHDSPHSLSILDNSYDFFLQLNQSLTSNDGNNGSEMKLDRHSVADRSEMVKSKDNSVLSLISHNGSEVVPADHASVSRKSNRGSGIMLDQHQLTSKKSSKKVKKSNKRSLKANKKSNMSKKIPNIMHADKHSEASSETTCGSKILHDDIDSVISNISSCVSELPNAGSWEGSTICASGSEATMHAGQNSLASLSCSIESENGLDDRHLLSFSDFSLPSCRSTSYAKKQDLMKSGGGGSKSEQYIHERKAIRGSVHVKKSSEERRSIKNLREDSMITVAPSRCPSSARSNCSRPRSSFIMPRQPQGPLSVRRSDPVALYHKYQSYWQQQKVPGDNRHELLRWNVRERMLGGGDPLPTPLSRAASVEKFNRPNRNYR